MSDDDVRPLALTDLCLALEHVAEDLELVDDDLSAHRHDTAQGANVVELHAIISDVNLGWAYVKTALTALQAYAAVSSG